MPRLHRNVYSTFLNNYALKGHNACPQHAAVSSCGLDGECALRPSLWSHGLTPVAVVNRCTTTPCLIALPHSAHRRKTGFCRHAATPRRDALQQQPSKPSLSQQKLSKPSTVLGMIKDTVHSAPSSRLAGKSFRGLTVYPRHC